jgi:hypothetical protein
MKLNSGRICSLLITAGLGFGSPLAHAENYTLKIVEDKHEQAVVLLEQAGTTVISCGILATDEGVPLVPGRSYAFWFKDESDLDEECPFLRVGFCAEATDLDQELRFDYVRDFRNPATSIENIGSPMGHLKWLANLKSNNINIYFKAATCFLPLPGAPVEAGVAMNETDDDPPAPAAEEKKAAAPQGAPPPA